jgi:hypothetical protein
MGVTSVAEREIIFWSTGVVFGEEGKLSWAPTVSGFMERNEPVFIYERPMLQLR